MDNARTTGSGGGRHAKVNEIDNIILDIVKKDSALLISLNVPDSGDGEEAEIQFPDNVDHRQLASSD